MICTYIHTIAIYATFIFIFQSSFHSILNIKSMWSFGIPVAIFVSPTLKFIQRISWIKRSGFLCIGWIRLTLWQTRGFGVFVWSLNMRAPWFGRRSGNKHSTSVATCSHDVGYRFFGLSKPMFTVGKWSISVIIKYSFFMKGILSIEVNPLLQCFGRTQGVGFYENT